MVSKKKILDHEIRKIISVLKRSLLRRIILILNGTLGDLSGILSESRTLHSFLHIR
jgi:hypothetical protein